MTAKIKHAQGIYYLIICPLTNEKELLLKRLRLSVILKIRVDSNLLDMCLRNCTCSVNSLKYYHKIVLDDSACVVFFVTIDRWC
jgi:hypothetical protein